MHDTALDRGQLSLALDAHGAAQTAVLDQQPSHTSSGNSELDCDGCSSGSLVVAEDSVLTATSSLVELTLWGGYESDQLYADAFEVEVMSDDAGSPSASVLVSGDHHGSR